MEGQINLIKQKIKIYEEWVAKNPNVVNEFEAASKWLSFFLVSRFSNSRIASEFVYSAANLLVLYHDRILARAKPQNLQLDENITIVQNKNSKSKKINNLLSVEQLKILLTTIEHCEVFVELSVQRFSGVRGKWLTVAFLQLLTCAGRLLLLKHSHEKIVVMPPIPFVNRKELANTPNQSTLSCESQTHISEAHSVSVKLKRSGRILRKVEGAPPLHFRDFNIFNSYATNSSSYSTSALSLNSDKLHGSNNKKFQHAEYVYIAKPLVHLAAMYLSGNTRSWTPYCLSLAMDLASLRVIYANRHLLNKEQRLELSRRCIRLVLYLMRSPFYERHTSSRLQLVFKLLGNVPLLRLITNALQEYIPLWQKTYFQTWGI